MIDTLRLRHVFMPLFCLGHMTAVAFFVVPVSYPGGMGKIGQALHDVSAPYVLSLSQWQQWNLFAPDPIRRVSRFVVDMRTNNQWVPTAFIDPTSRAFYEYPKLMKVLGRLETTHAVLVEPFLLFYCQTEKVTQGKELRLRINYVVLPNDLFSLTHLSLNTLPITERIAGRVTCPSSVQQ